VAQGAEEALELWRGELLTGLEDDWLDERRQELSQRLSDALGRAADDADARGDLRTALSLTRRQVALDSLAEEPQRELIRRLARAGDRTAALAAYDKLSYRLREQLETAPSAATRELADAVRLGETPSQTNAGSGELSGMPPRRRPRQSADPTPRSRCRGHWSR
jgi:DNA-binding SARP family transcriptional activator